jgi:mycofactocin precursor
MSEPRTQAEHDATQEEAAAAAGAAEAEVLVEDVSIDGMCGVY